MSLRQQPSSGDQRRTIAAIALIMLISVVWMWQFPAETPPSSQEAPVTDSSEARQRAQDQAQEQQALTRQQRQRQEGRQARQAQPDVPAGTGIEDSTIAGATSGTARPVVVETERYTATFSTKGATLTSFELKEYDTFDETTPVQIVDTTSAGAISLAFTTPESHLVNTRSFYFDVASENGLAGDTLHVEEPGTQLRFTTGVGKGSIQQTYTFAPETYEVGLSVKQQNAPSFATREGYDLIWDGGLPYSEASPEDEAPQAGAFARSGGEIESMRLLEGNSGEKRLSGEVDWVAAKNKYFTAVAMPSGPTRAAEIIGEKVSGPSSWSSEARWKDFTLRLQMPRAPDQQADQFRFYLGPMDYYKISSYDLDLYGMVDYGWDFFEVITRPIAKYFFIPVFKVLGSVLPNYGLVIIVLALLVITLVYPLTKSSYKSMAKMKELQPRMEAIREEHADDQEKQTQAMMKLYKEAGANPLGGCLPMLLQYPVIITLWQFLPTSIDIRQESFLWAHDLSVPDVILSLPFDIPVYGDYVAGFTLLMGLSMIVSMRVQATGGSGGQMKVLTYLFPIMIFVIFNRYAAGLSLYYLIYNVTRAGQQKYINRQIEQEKDEEETTANGEGTKEDVREARRRHRREKAKT